MSKKRKYSLTERLRKALRETWLFHCPARKAALMRARAFRGAWFCNVCAFPTKKPKVDHIVPVGSTPGARGSEGTDWNGFMARLFCDVDGLQILCDVCHKVKTKNEK